MCDGLNTIEPIVTSVMPTTTSGGRYPTLDEAESVVRSDYPRRLQHRQRSFELNIPKPMAQFMQIDFQGAELDPCLVTGDEPVVVDEQAIVITPKVDDE